MTSPWQRFGNQPHPYSCVWWTNSFLTQTCIGVWGCTQPSLNWTQLLHGLMSEKWICLLRCQPGKYCDMACFPRLCELQTCVCLCVCCCGHVSVLSLRTGGGQQGWEQASEQVEYQWGGNNTVWSPLLLQETWREMLQVMLTAHCCSPCVGQNLVQVHLCHFVYLGNTCRYLLT